MKRKKIALAAALITILTGCTTRHLDVSDSNSGKIDVSEGTKKAFEQAINEQKVKARGVK